MEVERHDPVGAGARDQIGDKFGRDGRAWTRFAILPGIAVIGNDCGDPARRRPAQRIDDDQQFHQVVVGGKRRRLDDENVRAAHVFLNFDEHLHVGEAPHDGFGQGSFEILGDRLASVRIGIAGDELDRSVLARHLEFLALTRATAAWS